MPDEETMLIAELAGSDLLTRDQGAILRKKLLDALKRAPTIRIDFKGVEVMAPSFADEAFGQLFLELGKEEFRHRVQLICESEATKRLVNAVIANRLRRREKDEPR